MCEASAYVIQDGKDSLILENVDELQLLRYLATKAPRHQDYIIILYNCLFNGWQIEVHEKTPLLNFYLSSLCVFGSWWLNSYDELNKEGDTIKRTNLFGDQGVLETQKNEFHC